MQRRALLALVAAALLLALAGPAAGQQLGPASAAALHSVDRAPGTRGAMNPGRAAAVLARVFRASGDRPARIACRMTSPDTATCTLEVRRAGVTWIGTGRVWQGRRAYRASYDMSASD